MGDDVEVTGVVMVQKRIATFANSTAKGMERGLVKAVLQLLALTQAVVPVDTGNLKASGAAAKSGSGFHTVTEVSYSTDYAIFVHENLDAQHAPGKQAQYITGPAAENSAALFKTVRDEAAKGDRGSIPSLVSPDVRNHAILPIMPRGPGSYVRQSSGQRVTYVRKANSKTGLGGWRRKR